MKTRYLLTVLAGVALASCVTNNEYEPNLKNEQAKVAFSSPVMYNNHVASRAVVHGEIGSHQYTDGGITYTYPKEENFIIYAVKNPKSGFESWADSDPTAFNGETISYDNKVDGWAPKPTNSEEPYYLWDSNFLMTYAASSPADLQQDDNTWKELNELEVGANLGNIPGYRIYDGKGLTIKNFKVPEDASEQFDLLFSQRMKNKSKDDMYHGANYYSGLPVRFMHALSSIRFSISNKSDISNVVLTKISLSGVKDVGTFYENYNEEYTGAEYTVGENGQVNPIWDIAEDAENVSAPYVAFSGELEFPIEPRYVSELNAEKTASNSGNENVVNVLLLLPQGLTSDAKLHIEYKVNGNASNANVELLNARKIEYVDGTNKETITQHSVNAWNWGTRYTYRLVYSDAAAEKDRIYFSPKTDEWIDAGVAVIDLSGEVSQQPPTGEGGEGGGTGEGDGTDEGDGN